jgi:hypothetical protein
MRRVLLFVLAVLVPACGSSAPPGAAGEVVAAWKKAGLDVSDFAAADGKALGATSCFAGKVAGVEATVCELADADAAKRAEKPALAQVGDATGAALAQGRLLLVVADRAKADPTGKKIKDIAAAFRNR